MKHDIWLSITIWDKRKKPRKQNEAENKGQKISEEIWGFTYLGGGDVIMWSKVDDPLQKLLHFLHICDSQENYSDYQNLHF